MLQLALPVLRVLCNFDPLHRRGLSRGRAHILSVVNLWYLRRPGYHWCIYACSVMIKSHYVQSCTLLVCTSIIVPIRASLVSNFEVDVRGATLRRRKTKEHSKIMLRPRHKCMIRILFDLSYGACGI